MPSSRTAEKQPVEMRRVGFRGVTRVKSHTYSGSIPDPEGDMCRKVGLPLGAPAAWPVTRVPDLTTTAHGETRWPPVHHMLTKLYYTRHEKCASAYIDSVRIFTRDTCEDIHQLLKFLLSKPKNGKVPMYFFSIS